MYQRNYIADLEITIKYCIIEKIKMDIKLIVVAYYYCIQINCYLQI